MQANVSCAYSTTVSLHIRFTLFILQPLVRVRDPPLCRICELVMKQLESMLEDQATEVRRIVLLDVF